MNVRDAAKEYGCHELVVLGDNPGPRHLDYLDLLPKTGGTDELCVDAVAEFQSRPLLYLVSGNQARELDSGRIRHLQQVLANRGERAYLAFLTPGELNVYPVNLAREELEKSGHVSIGQKVPGAGQFFQSVVTGNFSLAGQPEGADYVFKTIHELMARSSKRLVGHFHLAPLDVLSFLGRALFFRFLVDRRIVLKEELDGICPGARNESDCFATLHSALATSTWLDETFNGDLLPFSGSREEIFRDAQTRTNGEVFRHLQAIVAGWQHVGHSLFQPHFPVDWADLDFSHIPIGVLSQVYEHFSQVWDNRQAEATSVYYTPKNIARYLVDDAFEGIADKGSAKVLDPSCGAGIFLILAFRKLVAARWEEDGKRPTTEVIQQILYSQIRGFDISESALRLAALSLYVTAIELNDSPRPPESLKFPSPLMNQVLFNHRRENEVDTDGFVLGSLRPDLPSDFGNCFDLVIGNPPWSRIRVNRDKTAEEKPEDHNAPFTELTREILKSRGLAELAQEYSNPDSNPDLPFLWAATRWAKTDAIIAMALPARIFLKQTPAGRKAWQVILRGIRITGILNGSNLSDTDVWPKMNQPFMLLFARNSVPDDSHHFYFATPYYEPRLNEHGRLRIDYQAAQPVSVRTAYERPDLLKILAIGTSLDTEVAGKLGGLDWQTVKSYWKGMSVYSGRGYDRSPDSAQNSAEFMLEMRLRDFVPPPKEEFHVDIDSLLPFQPNGTPDKPTLHRPRQKELYEAPLLIVPEAPGELKDRPRSWVMMENVAFKKSFYGFSGYGTNSGVESVRLLHLITHSKLFAYHILMVSSRMGAERRAFLKRDLENFPFPNPTGLLPGMRNLICQLSRRLETDVEKPWDEINQLIFDLYGLDEYDRQVVEDTLEVCSPYKASRNRAVKPPTQKERQAFYAQLERFLAPSFDVTEEALVLREYDSGKNKLASPWHFFTVATETTPCASLCHMSSLQERLMQEADRTGASRVVVCGEKLLLIGVLSQYRYWTPSRARLCALDILRTHMDAFPVEAN